MALGTAPVIKRLHTLRRIGKPDVLFGILTRAGNTDALYEWYGSPAVWNFVLALPGTDLIYDTVTWQERMHIADGKNPILRLDETVDCFTNAPVVQYLAVFQDRLIGAGDARLIPSEVAEVDSNRDRVLFCEALEFTLWSPNNFIGADTGTSEQITGLGVNSITSSERGAQSQLAVFKPHSIYVNDGTLGSGDQRLSAVSKAIGCPSYNTIKNTPFGLVFMSTETVCMLDTQAREPNQIGVFIGPAIKQIPYTTDISTNMQQWACGYFHDQTYKLSIAATSGAYNSNEWWMDMRPVLFPQEINWYGPHTGDRIFQYEVCNNQLIGAEFGTDRIWRLDVEGKWGSMTAQNTARTSTMVWPRVPVPGMKRGMIDAYGFKGVLTQTDTNTVALTESIDIERGVQSYANTFSIPIASTGEKAYYAVTRPIRRPGYDVQVTVNHSAPDDITVDTIYLRNKTFGRQSEKQNGTTQS